MRAREKRLSDYGVPEDKQKWLYVKCQELDELEYQMLWETAFSICPIGIAEDIVSSLTEGMSYRALRKIKYVPINDDDFYSWRRKTLAEFYHRLKGDIT